MGCLRRKINLNDISHDAAADLIASVCKKGVQVTQVWLDPFPHTCFRKGLRKSRRRYVKLQKH